jgi:hypothetical protein
MVEVLFWKVNGWVSQNHQIIGFEKRFVIEINGVGSRQIKYYNWNEGWESIESEQFKWDDSWWNIKEVSIKLVKREWIKNEYCCVLRACAKKGWGNC